MLSYPESPHLFLACFLSDPEYLGAARTVWVNADRKCSLAPGLKEMLGPCCTLDLCPFSLSTPALAVIRVVKEAAGFPRPPAYCTRSFCWALGCEAWSTRPTVPSCLPHTLMWPWRSGWEIHGQVLSWSSLVLGEVTAQPCRALWSWPKDSQEAHTLHVSLQCFPAAQLKVMYVLL